jgi:hypothetical protein
MPKLWKRNSLILNYAIVAEIVIKPPKYPRAPSLNSHFLA